MEVDKNVGIDWKVRRVEIADRGGCGVGFLYWDVVKFFEKLLS